MQAGVHVAVGEVERCAVAAAHGQRCGEDAGSGVVLIEQGGVEAQELVEGGHSGCPDGLVGIVFVDDQRFEVGIGKGGIRGGVYKPGSVGNGVKADVEAFLYFEYAVGDVFFRAFEQLQALRTCWDFSEAFGTVGKALLEGVSAVLGGRTKDVDV